MLHASTKCFFVVYIFAQSLVKLETYIHMTPLIYLHKCIICFSRRRKFLIVLYCPWATKKHESLCNFLFIQERIKDVFGRRKRLVKEYEQLAIWFGDCGTEDEGTSQSSTTYLQSKNPQVQWDSSEPEWEIIQL